MTVVNPEPLMRQYLEGKPDLTNDEREILLFALYMESVKNGGLAAKVCVQLRGAIAEGQQSSELVEKTSRDTEGESSRQPQGGQHHD